LTGKNDFTILRFFAFIKPQICLLLRSVDFYYILLIPRADTKFLLFVSQAKPPSAHQLFEGMVLKSRAKKVAMPDWEDQLSALPDSVWWRRCLILLKRCLLSIWERGGGERLRICRRIFFVFWPFSKKIKK
jgi:hypothetical protein